jgi:hypothetical protein
MAAAGMFARGYLDGSYAFTGDYDAAGWAALLAGRGDEAIKYASQAAEANPEFPDIHAVLTSANGHLGRAGPARAAFALAQLSRRMLGLTIGDERLNRTSP